MRVLDVGNFSIVIKVKDVERFISLVHKNIIEKNLIEFSGVEV